MRLPRFLHRWYAQTFGYFWLPCPLCGRPFGGHEWGRTLERPACIITGPGTGTGVCDGCDEVAREINWRTAGLAPVPGCEVSLGGCGEVVFVRESHS
jgi:hypothetical protein